MKLCSVKAGRLGRPHGLDGFIGLYADPEDLVYFDPGSTVFIEGAPYTVRAVRRADRGYHVSFEGVRSRNAAEEIRNLDITVPERRDLGDHEFWPDQLVGLEVRPGGGKVTGILYGPAQDRLSVDRDGVRFEIPFVDDLVPVVNIDEGYVEIVELDGLTEL